MKDVQLFRVVADREIERYIRARDYHRYDVLEVSGDRWKSFEFKSYRSTTYPEYDLCAQPLGRELFDLVFVEHVLEHLPSPGRSVRNVWEMLRMGGSILVVTPFLIRIHLHCQDYHRWTELGLRNLLTEGGFDAQTMITGAWGNRSSVRANFEGFVPWIPWLDSLKNEPEFPVSVWAFARKTNAVPRQ